MEISDFFKGKAAPGTSSSPPGNTEILPRARANQGPAESPESNRVNASNPGSVQKAPKTQLGKSLTDGQTSGSVFGDGKGIAQIQAARAPRNG